MLAIVGGRTDERLIKGDSFEGSAGTQQLGNVFKTSLSGPAGCPRENLSLIGTGLTGLLSWAPSIFIPENRPGLRLSLGG